MTNSVFNNKKADQSTGYTTMTYRGAGAKAEADAIRAATTTDLNILTI